MTKKLILMRHGNYSGVVLNKSGQQEVDNVAEQLVAKGLVPDIIIHSPVIRAVETAERLQAVFNRATGKAAPMVSQPELSIEYESPKSVKLDDDNVNTALAVSHQPNIVSLLSEFSGCTTLYPETAEAYVLENSAAESWKSFNRGQVTQTFSPG